MTRTRSVPSIARIAGLILLLVCSSARAQCPFAPVLTMVGPGTPPAPGQAYSISVEVSNWGSFVGNRQVLIQYSDNGGTSWANYTSFNATGNVTQPAIAQGNASACSASRQWRATTTDGCAQAVTSNVVTINGGSFTPTLSATGPAVPPLPGEAYNISVTVSNWGTFVGNRQILIQYSDNGGASWANYTSFNATGNITQPTIGQGTASSCNASRQWRATTTDGCAQAVTSNVVAINGGSFTPTLSASGPAVAPLPGESYNISVTVSNWGTFVGSRQILIQYSDNGGASWANYTSFNATGNVTQPAIAQGNASSCSASRQWRATTTDGCAQAVTSNVVTINGGSFTPTLSASGPAVAPLPGESYNISVTVSNWGTFVGSRQILIQYSDNGGTSWANYTSFNATGNVTQPTIGQGIAGACGVTRQWRATTTDGCSQPVLSNVVAIIGGGFSPTLTVSGPPVVYGGRPIALSMAVSTWGTFVGSRQILVQYSDNGGTTWANYTSFNVSGNTTQPFSTPATTLCGGSRSWRTTTTDGCSLPVYSNTLVLTWPAYPNCDGSTAPPVLNVNDFTCFLNKFAAGDEYANCDGSVSPPVLNVNDFACFLNAFAAGCP